MDKLYAGTQEEQAPVDGIIKGNIPKWISGSLFRNGPAMYEVGGQTYIHLFDGLAAIQKFEIKNGKATYSRKFVKSESYKKNMAANKIVVSEFGTPAYYSDPCKTLFQRFFAMFVPDKPTDNTSVSVWPLKDKLYASTETNVIHEIDPENLDTVDRVGNIPKWISGSLFRNGPAMYEVGGQTYIHLFDGLAAIQKFEIKNGKATYSRKFVKSESYKKNMAANKIVVSEFGTPAYYSDPCKTLFQRFFAMFVPDKPTDNTSVSVWPLKDKLYASTETNVIHEIDPENLDTVDRVGNIPKWISGSLFRNGPAMYEVGGQTYIHLFDGLAAIQKFEIKNGKATYSRKFVKSESYKKNMAANKIVVSEFGTPAYYSDPCKTLFQRFFAMFVPDKPTDNTSVSVWPLKDKLYASTETNVIHEIDPENLDTVDRVNIKNYITVDSATAHPHWEPDGTVHNIGYKYGKNPSYCLMQIPGKEGGQNDPSDIKLVSSIPSRWQFNPGYYHSFAVTENYYVFLEQPLCINIFKIFTMKIRGISFSECIDWYENEKTLFHIIDKSTGEKVNSYTYQSDGFFVFHHGNAYEQDGQIVLDVCAYTDGSIMGTLSLEKLRQDYANSMTFVDGVQLKRFVLPLNIDRNVVKEQNLVKLENSEATAVLTSDTTIECKGEVMIDKGVEFPQVNYNKYNGKKYRYLYGIIIKNIFDTLVKVDMENKTYKVWVEEDCYASEPIFVANPDGQDEDDGVILTAVNSLKEGKFAFVLILDAKTFTEKARVEFPDIFLPLTFHGVFRNS